MVKEAWRLIYTQLAYKVHITRQYSECPRASNGRATVHVREARKQIESGITSVINARASREADSAAFLCIYTRMVINLSVLSTYVRTATDLALILTLRSSSYIWSGPSWLPKVNHLHGTTSVNRSL